MNVLFVDDQISVLEGIAAGISFQELGIDVVRYATGAEHAMDIMRATPIDVMLCDIEMPGEDGLHLISRAQKLYPELITIIMTSHADFEYAQVGVRLGCFEYIVQPAPYEVIEGVLRRALQHCYEQKKRNQLYKVGKWMQTGEMELLDRVAMNLFSSDASDVQASMELLNLIGYAVSPKKKAQLMILSVGQFRKTDQSIVTEKEIHKAITNALKQADISYPLVPLSTVDRHREFVLLVFSTLQDDPDLNVNKLRKFFDCLCHAMEQDSVRCYVGQAVCFDSLHGEYHRVRDSIREKGAGSGIIRLDYDPDRAPSGASDYITGSGAHWRSLLAAGQYRMLMNEFDDCLERITYVGSHASRGLCDLHQRMTHMFFTYFYDNSLDVHSLFQDQFSYYDYMNSYSNPDALREAMYFMMKKVKELNTSQAPRNDVEKAKSYILDNIADAITVKDVADHVGLSAEYFTKLFKKETGQSIKEYITLMKVEAAKNMLAHSNISVGMVALELGYSNFSHFSQVFRKYENETPSEYRARLADEKRKNPEAAE
jgi:YesN/AraC family two-component response regulator